MKKILFATLLLISSRFTFAQDTIVKYNGESILAKIIEINPTEVKYKKFTFQDGPLYVEAKAGIKMIKYSNGTKEEFPKQEPITTTIPATGASKTKVSIGNDDYYGGTAASSPSGKIEILGSRYRIQNKVVNEKKMQKVLIETNDKKIMNLVDQAKHAQKLQYIGFASIILGQVAFVAAANSRSYNSVTMAYGSTNNGAVALSAICFAGAIACPIISINQKHKRRAANIAAIKLYNEKF
jgi:hypothetical protein